MLGLSATAMVQSEAGSPRAHNWGCAQSQPLTGRYGGSGGYSDLSPQDGAITSPRDAKSYAQTVTERQGLPAIPGIYPGNKAKRDWVGFLS